MDRLNQQVSGVNSPNQDSFSYTRLGLLVLRRMVPFGLCLGSI